MARNREYTDTELWANKGCILNTIPMLSAVLAMFVADGLSRYQSSGIYNVPEDLSRRVWPMRNASTFNEFRIFSTWLDERAVNHAAEPDRVASWTAMCANGYAYCPSKNSDYFALAVVSIYIALVLSHMAYSLTGKKGTSNAWNSVTELLVLYQNSPPPATSHKLDNSSAGSSQLKTYRLVLLDDSVGHELGRVDVMESQSGGSSVSGKGVTAKVTDIEMGSIAPAASTSDATTSASSALHLHNTLRQPGLRVVEMDEKYA
ncbi:hypothetical protein B0A48_00378 [Cryoendolithus antarcticus]|uniref:Uncharacterized protein n=1 Tax=Cryoendolithus antarcticus TaxID=1507870 RepID=A0A1V8TUI8_9PEZI|nr:hypothetical protein B0A48_00378 [Cryoendolithus antarcticus]